MGRAITVRLRNLLSPTNHRFTSELICSKPVILGLIRAADLMCRIRQHHASVFYFRFCRFILTIFHFSFAIFVEVLERNAKVSARSRTSHVPSVSSSALREETDLQLGALKTLIGVSPNVSVQSLCRDFPNFLLEFSHHSVTSSMKSILRIIFQNL